MKAFGSCKVQVMNADHREDDIYNFLIRNCHNIKVTFIPSAALKLGPQV
jgi:hypothetical protein